MPIECRNGSSTAPSSANRAAAFWPRVTAARNSSNRVLASFIVMAFRVSARCQKDVAGVGVLGSGPRTLMACISSALHSVRSLGELSAEHGQAADRLFLCDFVLD